MREKKPIRVGTSAVRRLRGLPGWTELVGMSPGEEYNTARKEALHSGLISAMDKSQRARKKAVDE